MANHRDVIADKAPSIGMKINRYLKPVLTLCIILVLGLTNSTYGQTTYTFNGNGNWSDSANWVNRNVPPSILSNNSEIIINPVDTGICILNTFQIISYDGKLTIITGKKFVITEDLLSYQKRQNVILDSLEKFIGQQKDTIVLNDSIIVILDSNTFTSNTYCLLSRTQNSDAKQERDIVYLLFSMKAIANYEVRFNTGVQVPQKSVILKVIVPNDIKDSITPGYTINAYAQLIYNAIEESDQSFDYAPSSYDSANNLLTIELNSSYFSRFISKDGHYEVVITFGVSPIASTEGGRILSGDCAGGTYIACPLNNCDGSFVTSTYGVRSSPTSPGKTETHKGVDFRASVGTPVKAAYAGTVVGSGCPIGCATGPQMSGARGWGNYIIIRHKNQNGAPFATLYAHLSQIIKSNGAVSQGEIIALTGQSGGVSAPHLHIEYIVNGSNASRNAQRIDPLPCIETDSTFTDPRDGQVYPYRTIGTQVWMTKNLNYAPQWCIDCATYGGLYDWNTALKVVPPGWHLPSDAEWTTLTTFLGGDSVAGGAMKSITGWRSPNRGATNSSGFAGLPGGSEYGNGTHGPTGILGYWWSSTLLNRSTVWFRSLNYYDASVHRDYGALTQGFSVRCVRD